MEGRRRGGLVGRASRPDCFIVVVSMAWHHRCRRVMVSFGAAQSGAAAGGLGLRWGCPIAAAWGSTPVYASLEAWVVCGLLVFRAGSSCSCLAKLAFAAPYALGLQLSVARIACRTRIDHQRIGAAAFVISETRLQLVQPATVTTIPPQSSHHGALAGADAAPNIGHELAQR